MGGALLCCLVASPSTAVAHNVYFDFEFPDMFAGVTVTVLETLLLNLPPGLPSKHEELVYRAIGETCASDGDPARCFYYKTNWNDCLPGSGCVPWTVCGQADLTDVSECHEIGEPSGLFFTDGDLSGYDFSSLLVGARFVDMREQTGLEIPLLNSFADWMATDAGICHRPWTQTSSTAWAFPAQHSYATGRYLEDPALFEYPWWTSSDAHAWSVYGVAERNQAMLTAAASFLLDRFLQAQDLPFRESRLTVTDFTNIYGSLKEDWRAAFYLASLSVYADEIPDLAMENWCRAAGDVLLGGLIQWAGCTAGSKADARTKLTEIVAGGLCGAGASQLIFLANVLDPDDDPGEQLAVVPELFYAGQGAHTIADSFAHTIRDFRNIQRPGTADQSLAVAALRTSDPAGLWFRSHSDVADANGEFVVAPPPMLWMWDAGDLEFFGPELLMLGGGPHELGYANKEYATRAIQDWFAAFYDSTGRSFADRLGDLRQFVKRHLTYEYPQELAAEGRSTQDQPCAADADCAAVFEDGGTAVCDSLTFLCRRPCTGDAECIPGFTCGSGVRYDPSLGPAPRFCSVTWDPWETVADEYFVQTQRRGDEFTGKRWLSHDAGYSDRTGRRRLSRDAWRANEWYMSEFADTPGVELGRQSRVVLEWSREGCRPDDPHRELVAVVFSGPAYSGEVACITRTDHAEGGVGRGSGLPSDGVKSLYVEPRQFVCLLNSRDENYCLNGGLNGTAEGQILRAWRGTELRALTWRNLDTDDDTVLDYEDNCLLVHNPTQEDFDGDRYGDLCDRDIDGDLVLEDADGPWGLGNGTPGELCRRTGDADGLKFGQACDDNCPGTYNPAKTDLGPLFDGEGNPLPERDGVRDQFDLDGDGAGDSCDPDPDGDLAGLHYAHPLDYDDELPEQDPPHPVPTSTRVPYTECAEFVWALSEDKDDDGICDMYNFTPTFNSLAPWMPEPLYDGHACPGQGYLKPYDQAAAIDTTNAHYLSSSYVDHVGQARTPAAGALEVHVQPPPDADASEYPGEGGYTWGEYALVEGGEVYFGYEGCMRNLVDVWHYYGASSVDTTLGRQPSGEGLEVGFGFGIGDFTDGYLDGTVLMHDLPYWSPPERTHERADDADRWDNMVTGLNSMEAAKKSKKYLLTRALDPDICRVDNCARFMRFDGPDGVAEADIDPLSFRVMADDLYPGSEDGSAETRFCWTENQHRDAGDSDTAPYSGQLFCDLCDLDPHGVPDPSTCRPDPPDPPYAAGYEKWYRNQDQKDTNRDGIGDKCSTWIEIDRLSQDHRVDRIWSGTFATLHTWQTYAMDPAFTDWGTDPTTTSPPIDRRTGLPVRNWNDWSTWPADRFELVGLCDGACGTGHECTVKKYRVSPKQKVDFWVSGTSEDRIQTTIGACACALPDQDACSALRIERCFHPDGGDLWRTDPETYREQVIDREFVPGPERRPRYTGLRRFGNRSEELYGTTIHTECSPVHTIRGSPWGPDLSMLVGWDYNASEAADGCQQIGMQFDGRSHWTLDFAYTAQVEPDPREFRDWAAWVATYPDGKGDWRWMDGYTTNIRVGILKGPAGPEYWERQFHSPVYPCDPAENPDCEPGDPPDGTLADRDRPVPEPGADAGPGGFGVSRDGNVGLVYFQPECGGPIWPDSYYEEGRRTWPWEEVEVPEDDSGQETPAARVRVETQTAGASVSIEWARLVSGPGIVQSEETSYALPEPGFPERGFGALRLVLPRRAAAELFGYEGTEADVEADLIVGGRDGNGQPLAGVWLSRGWIAPRGFERLDLGVPAAVSASGGAPPPGSLAVAAPRLLVDTARERLLVVGGWTADGPLAQIHTFDLRSRTWHPLASTKAQPAALPPDTAQGRLAVDVAGRRAFLVSTTGQAARVFRVDFRDAEPTVRELGVPTGGPSMRRGAAATYSPDLDSLLVFGGTTAAMVGAGAEAGTTTDDAGTVTAADGAANAGAYLGDLWAFAPDSPSWQLLRANAGPGVARAFATLVAGPAGSAFVLGGADGTGVLPVDRALRLDAGSSPNAAWSTTDTDLSKYLVVDDAPHQATWRPGDPALYTLEGWRLKPDLSTPVQLVLEADPTQLELVTVSSTSAPIRSGSSGSMVGRATVPLVAGEQFYVALRGLSPTVPKAGIPFALRAISVMPQGRHWNIRSRDATRFDASGNAVYVANWSSLDIYLWNGATLAQVGSLAMQAAVDVAVTDGVAYVADFEQGLVAVDVSDPAAPQTLDTEWVLGNPDSVAIRNDRAYVGAGIFGVSVIDKTDPGSLTWVDQVVPGGTLVPAAAGALGSRAPAPPSVVDVSTAGSLLLVADGARTVWIYAVGADGRATQVGSHAALVPIEDTAVHGRTLYISDGRADMEVVDLAVPSSPGRSSVLHGPEWEVSARYGYDVMVQRRVGRGIAVLEMREVAPAHAEGDDDDDDDDDDEGDEDDEDDVDEDEDHCGEGRSGSGGRAGAGRDGDSPGGGSSRGDDEHGAGHGGRERERGGGEHGHR